jgi:hypothetical protein
VEDRSAPIPREITSKLGGSIYIATCAIEDRAGTLEIKLRIRMTLVEKGEEGRRVTDAPA